MGFKVLFIIISMLNKIIEVIKNFNEVYMFYCVGDKVDFSN